MNKLCVLGGILVILTILLALFNGSGKLAFLNENINRLHSPSNKYCTSANDCTFKKTSCNICDCGDMVRKAWRPMCPFRDNEIKLCEPCPQPRYKILCINNMCAKRPLTDADMPL